MTKRRKSRELALQFLYESDGDIANLESKIRFFYEDFAAESLLRDGFIKSREDLYGKKNTTEIFDFFNKIVRGTLSNIKEIDDSISSVSKNWSLERMPRVDRNLLRLSVYEIMFHPEIPKNVIINESVEIAKKFGNNESPSFINGILDAVVKK